MTIPKFIKALSFVVGLLLVAIGGAGLFVAATGDFIQGRTGAYIGSYSIFAIAAPLLVFPFSSRAAKVLTFIVLAAFAGSMLWTAFGSSIATSWTFQVAAVAFGVLLLVRVGLALRRRAFGAGT